MAVVATAGHVDHGKSALVRALTGTDPDRLAAERSRGLTLDLGHAHLRLPSGRLVGIVDVPGHERYLGTTVSGIGPAGGVLFCVAGDEGWSVQSEQHARACAALGLTGERVILVVTKSDRAGDGGEAPDHLSRLGLEPRATVACSATTGAGMAAVVAALADLEKHLATAESADGRRLWVDRSFTLPGAGTVVTGTLPSSTLQRGQSVHTPAGARRVRRLHRYGVEQDEVSGPDRVALNLVGVSAADVPRGTALTWGDTPAPCDRVAVDLAVRFEARAWPSETLVSFGTVTRAARLSSSRQGLRLVLPAPHQLWPGDRVLVRDPGGRTVLGGLRVTGPAIAYTTSSPPATTTAPAHPGDSTLLAHLAAHPLSPPSADQFADWGVSGADLRRLAAAGAVTYLGRGLTFGATLPEALRTATAGLPGEFTVSQLRQRLGISRAHTLALLAHTDARGLTRRHPSDGRTLRTEHTP